MLQVIAICLGACVGALARWGLGLWLNTSAALLPWGTLAANLIGGYLVGVCVAVFNNLPELDPVWRLALVTGFSRRADDVFELQRRGGGHDPAPALHPGAGHGGAAPAGLADADGSRTQDSYVFHS
jgi:hypothetical protein